MKPSRQIDIEFRGYRCFSGEPVRLNLKPGFTAFVGPNNAGKSTVLRLFFELRRIFKLFNVNSFPVTDGRINIELDPSIRAGDLFSRGRREDISISLAVPGGGDELNRLELIFDRELRGQLRLFTAEGEFASGGTWSINCNEARRFVQFNGHQRSGDALFGACALLSDAIYMPAFRNSLDLTSDRTYFDLQVGKAFVTMWHHLKAGSDREGNRVALTVERSIADIFGLSTFQANPVPSGKTLQVYVDQESFDLEEVGSGLSHFLMVLAHAAVKRPGLVLIDEPEIGLHPSLQLEFLTHLTKFAKFGTLFTTHSLGLARSAANSHIYSVSKEKKQGHCVRPFYKNPRLSEFLGEMSYGGYSDLGFKHILLVEGITDVPAFQVLLRGLGKDHRIVIITLGGSTMINDNPATRLQLEELCRITGSGLSITAIIDSEKTSEADSLRADRLGFENLCRSLNIKCHILARRSTEHYWTDQALKNAGFKGRALQPFEPFHNGWSKEENWKIAGHMSLDELADLGQILANIPAGER